MSESSPPAPILRPYFIPQSVDYDALPEHVRQALVNVVGPAYQDLVVNALTALERSSGLTLVFLLTLEVFDQFALANATDFAASAPAPAHDAASLATAAHDEAAAHRAAAADAAQQRNKLIESHLRLICVKQMSARFVLRLNLLRQTPYTGTMRRLPI